MPPTNPETPCAVCGHTDDHRGGCPTCRAAGERCRTFVAPETLCARPGCGHSLDDHLYFMRACTWTAPGQPLCECMAFVAPITNESPVSTSLGVPETPALIGPEGAAMDQRGIDRLTDLWASMELLSPGYVVEQERAWRWTRDRNFLANLLEPYGTILPRVDYDGAALTPPAPQQETT